MKKILIFLKSFSTNVSRDIVQMIHFHFFLFRVDYYEYQCNYEIVRVLSGEKIVENRDITLFSLIEASTFARF